MNIEMFMAQMNGEHKEAVIQKHITRQYVPLEEKIATAKNIIAISCYKDVVDANGNKRKMFWVDSVTKHFLTMKAIIEMYTDLKFSDDPVKDYNMLTEKKYDQMILEAITNDDVISFNNMVNTIYGDEYENVNSIQGHIKNFIFGFDNILQEAITKIALDQIDGGSKDGETTEDSERNN